MKKFSDILARIERIFEYIAQGFVFVLMLTVTADVVGRYAFNYPIPGASELAILLIVFITYLGIAYTQSVGGHVRVEVLVGKLSANKREMMGIVALSIALVTLSIMFWRTGVRGIEAFVTREFQMALIDFPVWPGRLVVPLGILFLCLRIAIQIVEHIIRLRQSPASKITQSGEVSS